ncbi:MAG: hypothetical protein Q8Q46_03580 [Candidatus Giovannonibacteria bacterium]|nr:hypothetical protein [Candidatus Giovannonibacteria bacterium]
MPKHHPIYFKDPNITDQYKAQIKRFVDKHPTAASVSKAVLAVALLGGAITVAFVAPGLVKILGKNAAAHKREQKERYRKLWERFYTLKKRGLFELKKENSDGSLIYQFTEKGHLVSKKFLLETLEIEKPQKWDGKWRIVSFDIPEKNKLARRAFQQKLRELNFFPLQKSVWVHPFPCESEIKLLCDLLQINPFVEIFVSGEITNGKLIYYFQNLIA